jgi:uncharacterized SAM-binding protein YcdF (DUF218 family)
MLKKWIKKVIFIVAGSILFFIAYSAYSIWSFSSKNELVKSDVAIVLGAAVWGDKPSPVLRERINHSIWLYNNGFVDKIIFTGGVGEDGTFSESEVAKTYAIKKNVKPEDILIETKSKITEENLNYAKEIAIKNNLKSFTVVSDPLHMKRAILMAKVINMEVYSSPTPSSVYRTLETKLPFFFRELFYYIGFIISIPFRSVVLFIVLSN